MKKASPLKSVKKSMASFMTARLSSAHCEGGPGNPPFPTLKTEKEREKGDIYRDRGWKTAKLASPLFGSIYTGVRRSDLVLFSPYLSIHNAKHWQIKSLVSVQIAEGTLRNLQNLEQTHEPYTTRNRS